ncbi:hypothetical protein GCM10020331_094860 [Ectobacillus funiculus]
MISTASSHNHKYVKSLGADYVIDYHQEDVTERVMEITDGHGVDAVVDAVSRQSATDSLDALAFFWDTLFFYIRCTRFYKKIKLFLQKSVSYHEIALGAAHQSGSHKAQQDLRVMGDEMLKLVVEGKNCFYVKKK